MRARFRSTFRPLTALSITMLMALGMLATGFASSASAAAPLPAPPAYYPSGPQISVDESALTGWTQCWSSTYDSNVPLGDILDDCDEGYLLLAGGPVGNTTFDVVAAAPRADVITPTPADLTTTHNANGTEWYFNSSQSWGFAQGGAAVFKDSCDYWDLYGPGAGGGAQSTRLCWHASGSSVTSGWRSGVTPDLNDNSYRRVIYEAGTYPLQVTVFNNNTSTQANGSVTSDVAGIDCPATCDAGFGPDKEVVLTAVEGANTRFTGWGGDCSGVSLTCNVTIDGAKNVEANFIATKNLHININGETYLENQGFEAGSAAWWDISMGSGGVSTQLYGGPAPLGAGSYFTTLTTGDTGTGTFPSNPTVVSQEFEMHAGQRIRGYARWFGNSDVCGYGDYGQTSILKIVGEETLWDGNDCVGPTGWETWTWVAPEDGTYTLRARAGNGYDDAFSSAMGFDVANMPGPSSPVTGEVTDGDNICTSVCDWSYDEGATVNLTATPDSAAATQWGMVTGGACEGSLLATCDVTMDGDRSAEADFGLGWDLDVTVNNSGSTTSEGSIVASEVGIDCPTDSCSTDIMDVNPATEVTLTAVAPEGTRFDGWSGDCASFGTDEECTVTMDMARSATANFVKTWTIKATKSGTGDGVIADGFDIFGPGDYTGIDCGDDCTVTVDDGTEPTFDATADGSSVFTGFSGVTVTGGIDDGTRACLHLLASACTPGEVNGNMVVNANFTRNKHGLTIDKTGAGDGLVTSSPSGIDCGPDCSALFDATSEVTLTAMPDDDSDFMGWSGAGCSGTDECVVTIDGMQEVEAEFVPTASPNVLTITKAGTGTGAVTSSPVGIGCGSTCSANFARNASVTLTASPGGSSTFAGWTGDCEDTSTVCVVTVNGPTDVTATFDGPPSLTVTTDGTGSGTVFSNPIGIECGSNCTKKFALDTSVMLFAEEDEGSVFTGWTGDCSGSSYSCLVTIDGAKDVNATFDTYSFQPDATIQAGAGAVLGLGIINDNGANQTVANTIKVKKKVTYNIEVWNDGTPFDDSFWMSGPPTDAKAKVTYKVGGNNVTSAVINGNYFSPDVAPGDSFDMQVIVQGKAKGKKTLFITAFSSYGFELDTVKAIVTVK